MRRAHRSCWLALLLALCASCVPSGRAKDYGDPTSLATPTESDGITTWVVSPSLTEQLDTATPTVVVAAYTAKHEALVVEMGRLEKGPDGYDELIDLRPARAKGSPGPEQRFELEVPLTHGDNRILVRVQTADHTRVRRMAFTLAYNGANPGLTLDVRVPTDAALLDGDVCSETEAISLGVTRARNVCVSGSITTLDDVSARVLVGLSGFERTSVTLDREGRFHTTVKLEPDQRSVIEVKVTDAAQRVTTAQLSLVQDETPPTLRVTSLARETANPTLEIEGVAADTYGLAALDIESADGAVQHVGAASPWTASVRLGVGKNDITVVARDVAGNEARKPLTLTRLRTIWLGPPTRDTGATQIEVDRFDLDELLTPENQKTLSLVQIDLAPAVTETLERIREPERYGVDTSDWGDAERNLQHILDMTPDTADLTGTSMEKLLTISSAVGLPTPRVLADLLDIGITEPIVDPDVAADVLMEQVVGSHPNVTRDKQGHYVIDVSMYDVFQDMRTIAPRFGAAGDHPGFLDGESTAEVLEPGFLLTLPVRSNLVQYDAVDLSRAAKDFLFLLQGDRVLDFNILTDEFVIVGLKDEPTIDLRFVVHEHPGPGLLRAGATQSAAPDASDPGFFRGDGQGWTIDPWLFERVAVEAGYRMFHRSFASDAYARVLRYDAGSIEDAAVIDWKRGWVTITTAGGIGDPPAPMYAWDLLMEVAQVRLHDHGVAEGQANMAFSLKKLPIGLTAQQLIDKLRPRLAEQEAKLSELFVGDIGLAASRADVFYLPASGKEGALLFRAPKDSETPYTYDRPGFFADLELKKKVSSTKAVGGVTETAHEKVPATLGAKYYVQDEHGGVYELEIAERDHDRIGVHVRSVEVVR